MTSATTSPDEAIQKLTQNWDQLSDPDRALAIAKIKKSGRSNRDLARILGRGEATIRRLLYILRAPAADLAAARNGSIRTNELIRHTDLALRKWAALRKNNAQRLQKQQASEGAKLIYKWIETLNHSGAYGEQIVEEVGASLSMSSTPGLYRTSIRPLIPFRLYATQITGEASLDLYRSWENVLHLASIYPRYSGR
jgi:hypothetical protein